MSEPTTIRGIGTTGMTNYAARICGAAPNLSDPDYPPGCVETPADYARQGDTPPPSTFAPAAPTRAGGLFVASCVAWYNTLTANR